MYRYHLQEIVCNDPGSLQMDQLGIILSTS